MPSELLCGRVAGLRFDINELASYYDNVVSHAPATQYFDNNAAYDGWSLTSRDGSISDGVKQISRSKTAHPIDSRRGTRPTALCTDVPMNVLNTIRALEIGPFRARIMRLANEGMSMKFHRDAQKESWRLHVPIYTNPASFFEWDLGSIPTTRIHFPADGSAYLVRVDLLHRAVNQCADAAIRVHMIMSLAQVPSRRIFSDPVLSRKD